MIGGLFAGTDESPGETILYQGEVTKSIEAWAHWVQWPAGLRTGDQQSGVESKKLVPEGVRGRVPNKGPIVTEHSSAHGRASFRHGLLRMQEPSMN